MSEIARRESPDPVMMVLLISLSVAFTGSLLAFGCTVGTCGPNGTDVWTMVTSLALIAGLGTIVIAGTWGGEQP